MDNSALTDEAELERERLTQVSVQEVEVVIEPLENTDPSLIKNRGELALVFALMYDKITFSNPASIKSTPRKEDIDFEKAKAEMIEWIKIIKDRDSGIDIHINIPNTKPSNGIVNPRGQTESMNNHLVGDEWNNRYDILMDSLSRLELPAKEETFFTKREKWKNMLKVYGMGKDRRTPLANAIAKYRDTVQKDLDNPDKHTRRRESIDLWIQSVPEHIKTLAPKLYIF